MTPPDGLPHGMTIIVPQAALFAEVCRRLGVEEAPADSILVRYDQRNVWHALGSIMAVLFFLYHLPSLIVDLINPHPDAIAFLALFIAFFGLFFVVFVRFFFIAAFGVHWFLCTPESIHILRYSPVASKALSFDRDAIGGFEISGNGWITNFRYSLTIALHDGKKKRTLVKLDRSEERIVCLHTLLEKRYAPPINLTSRA